MEKDNKANKMVQEEHSISRRNVIKALAGLPVLGAFGYELLKDINYNEDQIIKSDVVDKLGVEDIFTNVKPVVQSPKGDTLRIGIIGYGERGIYLMHALGFMHPEDYRIYKKENDLPSLFDLNVAVTGVCDVFDLHAERGLEAAKYDILTTGQFASKFAPKRYLHYQDMLADKNIDAVVIATPPHHHARMTIDAIKAGKHVYCEKSLIRRVDEIYEVYDVVKNSNLTFQLGHQVCQNVSYQQAKNAISKGLLGEISHIETSTNRNTPFGAWIRHIDENGNIKPGSKQSIDWKQWLGSSPEVPFSIERYYDWSRFFDYDTGLIGQLFSHAYDAVNYLLDIGIPKSVTSSGGQYFYKEIGEIPDVLQCTFEYPDRNLNLTYNANLASSRRRKQIIYGKDASMETGSSFSIFPDANSKKYKDLLEAGIVDPDYPMIDSNNVSGGKGVDAVTSATQKYYSSRGLISTNIQGRKWNLTHLHMKEWIDAIRNGSQKTSVNIDRAFEEGITLSMADISYREKCRVEWDPVTGRIKRCNNNTTHS